MVLQPQTKSKLNSRRHIWVHIHAIPPFDALTIAVSYMLLVNVADEIVTHLAMVPTRATHLPPPR